LWSIHSIKTFSSLVVYLTFDDFRSFDMTVMMICSSDDEFGYWWYWHYYRFFHF